ncbi:hypothetical protein GCM10028805_52200 [Spirosoma harenae]
MAHECISCGGDCFCSGDIDDSVDSETPDNCRGCGCEEDSPNYDPDQDPYANDDWDDIVIEQCPTCHCFKELDEINYKGEVLRVCFECYNKFEDMISEQERFRVLSAKTP